MTVRNRAPRGYMRLRVEKYLGVHHVLGASLPEVGHGQIVEGICRSHISGRTVREPDAVARRELEFEFRLERALYMDVQFGLWHAC